jgi:hypothetical protein
MSLANATPTKRKSGVAKWRDLLSSFPLGAFLEGAMRERYWIVSMCRRNQTPHRSLTE